MELKSKEKVQEIQMQQLNKMKNFEMQQLKKKFESEVRLKSEAMNKLEAMRQELFLIEGQDH